MRKCLITPIHGWSGFLCNDDMKISYIDDMPYTLLEELIASIKENRDFCLSFDAEGYEYTIVSSSTWNNVECIMRKEDKPIVFEIEENLRTFANKIIIDIEEDFDLWKDFPATYSNLSESIDDKYETVLNLKLQSLIKELKEVLKQENAKYR